ncbi:MAG: hypothetical protein P8X74_00295 [Reinekea sp.]|jgi:hypothetical protein
MVCIVNVFDKSTNQLEVTQKKLVLTFDTSSITVKALIEERVREEFRKHYQDDALIPLATTQDQDYAAAEREQPLDRLIKSAINGFTENKYFIIVDNQQVTDLNEVIKLNEISTVEFYRLVKLVGG